MKCRNYLPIVFVINISLFNYGLSNQFKERATLNNRQDRIDLPLVQFTTTNVLQDVASGRSKRSSSQSNAEQYSTVNVALPYKKIHYKPIAVAHTFGYSKKPDVYIEHVHVHNGVNPCQHSGITLHTAGGFECLCKKQYKGKHCEARNYCFPNPCVNGGNCVEKGNSFVCKCLTGFKGNTCADLDPCARGICKNGGTCSDLGNSKIVCICPLGFKGSTCEEVDHCDPNPCLHGGNCNEQNGKFTCSCSPDWTGSVCEVPKRCLTNPCRNGGQCIEGQSINICKCQNGFYGSFCENNVCYPDPCFNKGKCSVEARVDKTSYKCQCQPPYTGKKCEAKSCLFNGENLKVIKDQKTIQQPKQFTQTMGSYQHDPSVIMVVLTFHVNSPTYFNTSNRSHASLDPGKAGLWKQPLSCDITTYLRNKCALKPCKNGVCIDDASDYHVDLPLSGYRCLCKDGFDGVNCDQNICDNCDANAVCLYGQCICKNGFIGDGKHCKQASDICSTQPCKNDGKCVHAPPDSFDCVCLKGFTGPLCETVTPCDPNPCKNGAVCIVSGSTFKCKCPDGTTGPDCKEVKKKMCTPNFCLYGGQCHEPEEEGKGPFCECKSPKFLPPNCACSCEKANRNVDPQAVDPVCDAEGECTCLDGKRNYISGKGCVEARADPCEYFLCLNGGTKVAFQGSCTCKCPPSFVGIRCEKKIGAKCIPNPCKNNGTCEEIDGQIKCNCLQGFQPPFCDPVAQQMFSPCSPNPCQNGGMCKPLALGYDCQCTPRYTGPHCDVDKCLKCHKDAECIEGVCKCKAGFEGNGYNCIVEISSSDSSCYKCPAKTVCVSGVCQCTPGFVLNKRDCVPDKRHG